MLFIIVCMWLLDVLVDVYIVQAEWQDEYCYGRQLGPLETLNSFKTCSCPPLPWLPLKAEL